MFSPKFGISSYLFSSCSLGSLRQPQSQSKGFLTASSVSSPGNEVVVINVHPSIYILYVQKHSAKKSNLVSRASFFFKALGMRLYKKYRRYYENFKYIFWNVKLWSSTIMMRYKELFFFLRSVVSKKNGSFIV